MTDRTQDELPLVSIVIPVYKGSRFMREAIDSALAQTYANCEVIVVNDGSPDDGKTEEIAKSYGDRIRYFCKENGGCGSALNAGIAHMHGSLFSWLSHDDAYLPNKIARQVELMRASEHRDPIVYCGYELMDESSKRTGDMRPHAVLSRDQLHISLLPLLRGLIHGCALLIPKKYFDEIGVFDVNRPTTQDYALWFEFFRVAPLVYDEQLLVKSRVHPGQDTHRLWNQHVEECNLLWSGFLDQLADDEMSKMEGSPYRFLTRTAKFLSATPYNEARDKAESMAQERLANTKISVIMPFRDRFDWVLESIESVRQQTHSNWELVMVDDGSTGTSMKLCEAAESDPRIRYVLQAPSGPAAARNNGIRHATGSYLSFLDSDDLFTPDKLARQLAFMEENQFAISHTSYQRMTIEGKDGEIMHSASLRGAIFPSVIGRCTIAMPTVMGRREVFAHLSFPENNEIGEDVCLWIELSALHEWGGLDEPLTRVRISDQSCALNPRKQVIGLLNISLYCMRRDHLACHPDSIQKLVLAANRLLENRPPSVAVAEAPAPESLRTDLAEIADRSSNPRLDNGHALDTLYQFPSKISKEFGRAVRKLRRALQG